MESNRLPDRRNAPATDLADRPRETSVAPFPVADIVGTPLRPMSAAQITSITRDPGMAEAIRARLNRVDHLEIGPETELKDAIWLLAGALMALISIAVMTVAAVAVATS